MRLKELQEEIPVEGRFVSSPVDGDNDDDDDDDEDDDDDDDALVELRRACDARARSQLIFSVMGHGDGSVSNGACLLHVSRTERRGSRTPRALAYGEISRLELIGRRVLIQAMEDGEKRFREKIRKSRLIASVLGCVFIEAML